MLNQKLLDILACPICKGKLIYREDQQELICKVDALAFAISDDIPVLLEQEARKITLEEKDKL